MTVIPEMLRAAEKSCPAGAWCDGYELRRIYEAMKALDPEVEQLLRSERRNDVRVAELRAALSHCERYAIRIAANPDAHPFDNDAANGIIDICRALCNVALREDQARAAQQCPVCRKSLSVCNGFHKSDDLASQAQEPGHAPGCVWNPEDGTCGCGWITRPIPPSENP